MSFQKCATVILFCLLAAAQANQRWSPADHDESPDKTPIQLVEVSSAAAAGTELHKTESTSGQRQARVSSQGPQSVGFFENFAEHESTYDEDGDGQILHNGEDHIGFLHGWDWTSRRNPYVVSFPGDGSHFVETPSAGDVAAWSTMHRGIDAGGPAWSEAGDRSWLQNYKSTAGSRLQPRMSNPKAAWFDSSVDQYDDYGRQRQPNPGSRRSFIQWEERSVNTSLTCADVGCTANATMFAPYDPSTEEIQNCYLSVPVHPTDFDDQYSGERVEFIQVNDAMVNTDCFPMTKACNAELHLPMFNCLSQFPMDKLIDRQTGSFSIAAKISDVVDECPFDGNLFSAEPTLTCMVRPLPPPPAPPPPPPPQPQAACATQTVTRQASLQCAWRGCEAFAEISGFNDTAVAISNCRMNIVLNQTDFDGEEGSSEIVEYVKVSNVSLLTLPASNIPGGSGLANRTVASEVSPGQNACGCDTNSMLSAEEMRFDLVSDEDVTEELAGGVLTVTAKISDLVDECPSNGYLLDARVEVTCDMTCLSDWSLPILNEAEVPTVSSE